MPLNKVNLCWVLSDGRPGHEIQSTTLAQQLSRHTSILSFDIKQPWDSFTPRLAPLFSRGLVWHQGAPNFNQPPNLIITTGRKAAAAGKYVRQCLQETVPQVQILNPGDRSSHYALLLLPEHDLKTGSNIITFTGSIHPYSPAWFANNSQSNAPDQQVAVMLGNPNPKYFDAQWTETLQVIKTKYPGVPLCICGSPRTSASIRNRVKNSLDDIDSCWFDSGDGDNPYTDLLRTAMHLFVTTDSINMMNECAASQVPVTLLAKEFTPSPKHQRLIQQYQERWSELNDVGNQTQSSQVTQPVKYPLDQVLADERLLKLLKSPDSSSRG